MDAGANHAAACECGQCAANHGHEKAKANIAYGVPNGGGGDALVGGKIWGGKSVTYGFPVAAEDYDTDPLAIGVQYGADEPADEFAPLSEIQVEAVELAIRAISSVSQLQFRHDEVSADIRIAQSGAPSSAWAYFPDDDAEGGDVWFGVDHGFYDAPRKGNYAWHAFLHELGHAVGLKHGHEAGAIGAGQALAADRDTMEWSVMTYRSYKGDPMLGGYSNEAAGYAQTLMRADIAALQQLYGANYEHLSSDTHYFWDPETGELSIDGVGQGAPVANRIFATLWDGGGVDIIDASAYETGVVIDLTPGAGAVLSTKQLALLNHADWSDAPIRASANVYFAELHKDDPRALIENANGAGGADILIGNIGANRLFGDEGDDALSGGKGDDHLIGGDGDDNTAGGGGRDRLAGQAGADLLEGGADRDSILGGGGRDQLFGGHGRDRLVGGAGADELTGGRGADLLVGGAGGDVFRFDRRDGVDQIADFGRGADLIDLSGFNFGFDDLRFVDRANDVKIVADGLGVVLSGVEVESLTVDQFLF